MTSTEPAIAFFTAPTSTTAPQPLAWGAHALWEQLVGQLPGLSVEVVARIPSTNSALLERARVVGHDASHEPFDRAHDNPHPDTHDADSQPQALSDVIVRRSTESRAFGRRAVDWQPCLLVAEHQTAGRGRHGHHWHAAAGSSLTFSLALTFNPPDWSGLSLAVGVGLAEALNPSEAAPAGAANASPRLGIKWPNDLWLADERADEPANKPSQIKPGRKLGGVLIETVAIGNKRLVVVGVGLNVLPMGLNAAQASSGTACLQELHPQMDAPAALARVVGPLVNALQTFERSGFAEFVGRFAARDVLFQRHITTTQIGLEEGIAQGVSANGALQVQTKTGLQTVTSGEVSVRPALAYEDADAQSWARQLAQSDSTQTKTGAAC